MLSDEYKIKQVEAKLDNEKYKSVAKQTSEDIRTITILNYGKELMTCNLLEKTYYRWLPSEEERITVGGITVFVDYEEARIQTTDDWLTYILPHEMI